MKLMIENKQNLNEMLSDSDRRKISKTVRDRLNSMYPLSKGFKWRMSWDVGNIVEIQCPPNGVVALGIQRDFDHDYAGMDVYFRTGSQEFSSVDQLIEDLVKAGSDLVEQLKGISLADVIMK